MLSAAFQNDTSSRRNLEKDNKTEKKAVTMVVVNSLINFVLRLPEIFTFMTLSIDSLKSLTFDKDSSVFIETNFLGSLLLDLSYFMFILTFSIQIFLCTFLLISNLG
jgi:hypothetical protein